jgi:hypothetical protein
MSIKTDIEKDFSNKVEIQKDFVQANVINQSNYKSTNDKIVAKKFNLNKYLFKKVLFLSITRSFYNKTNHLKKIFQIKKVTFLDNNLKNPIIRIFLT